MNGQIGLEFLILIVALFVVIFISHVFLQRVYCSWISSLLACPDKEARTERFKRLFLAYFPLTLLATIGLFITISGFTTKIQIFDLTVFYYSSCVILFLVRAVHTTPLLKTDTDSAGFVRALVEVVWIGAIVSSMKFVLLYFWNYTEFYSLVTQIFEFGVTLTLSIEFLLKFLAAYVFPIVIVASVLEEMLFLYCRIRGVERRGTPLKN